MIRLLCALAMFLAGATAAIGSESAADIQSAAPKRAEAAPAMQLQGFRDAHWGMDANEVKAAIRKDFSLAPDKIQTEENATERTSALSIDVPGLIEGAGRARVSYIFGFTSKKLIQVNVVWGTPIDPAVKREELAVAGNQLRDLFLASGYQANSIHANLAAKDGTIVVFEGEDAEKHATLLTLSNGKVSGPADSGQHEPAPQAVILRLSYILDPQNPDIFRLKKGQF